MGEIPPFGSFVPLGRASILYPHADISGGKATEGTRMRKIKMTLVATLLAIPTVGLFAPPASACMGEVCEAINEVCYRTITKGRPCVK